MKCQHACRYHGTFKILNPRNSPIEGDFKHSWCLFVSEFCTEQDGSSTNCARINLSKNLVLVSYFQHRSYHKILIDNVHSTLHIFLKKFIVCGGRGRGLCKACLYIYINLNKIKKHPRNLHTLKNEIRERDGG